MELRVQLTGQRPLIQHNKRLANPLDPYVRELKKYTGKRKKTDEDYAHMMQLEARAGIYETDDGLVGIPNENVWRSFYDAATAFKRGRDLQRALIPTTTVEPIEIDGSKVDVESFLRDPRHVDYRSVKVGQSRMMRARPILAAGWVATFTFQLLTDIINLEDLDPIFSRAGLIVGLCEYRPRYGTYTAEVMTT